MEQLSMEPTPRLIIHEMFSLSIVVSRREHAGFIFLIKPNGTMRGWNYPGCI